MGLIEVAQHTPADHLSRAGQPRAAKNGHKKKLEADLAAANEALEAEKQKAAAAAKAHDDKVKELSGKVKELEAAAARRQRNQTKPSPTRRRPARRRRSRPSKRLWMMCARSSRRPRSARTTRSAAAQRAESLLSADDRWRRRHRGRRRRRWPLFGGCRGPTEQCGRDRTDVGARPGAPERRRGRPVRGPRGARERVGGGTDGAPIPGGRGRRAPSAGRTAARRRGRDRQTQGEIDEKGAEAERAHELWTPSAGRPKTPSGKLRETVTRRQADDEQDRRRNGVRARAWARATHALATRKKDDAQQASAPAPRQAAASRPAPRGVRRRARAAGELDVAERLYGEARSCAARSTAAPTRRRPSRCASSRPTAASGDDLERRGPRPVPCRVCLGRCAR